MKLKQWQNIIHAIANAISIKQLAIQIKNVIADHVNVNLKIITIFCYHYAKHRSRQKYINVLTIQNGK